MIGVALLTVLGILSPIKADYVFSTKNVSLPRSSLKNVGATVTLYDHWNYDGDTKTLTLVSGCTNVYDFNDRASSAKVSNGCVRLWEHGGCIGRSIDISAPGMDWLGGDFNDVTSSISPCDYPCYKEDVEIVMHLNGADDLKEHAEMARNVMIEWFPFIQSMLYTPAYRNIDRVDVFYDDGDFVAYAVIGANEIHVSKGFIRHYLGDSGVYIHEITHLIQQPRGSCPGWVVEGTAEYTRRWFYEPAVTPWKPTDPELDNPYIGDWLLYYLTSVMQKPIFYKITKACQDGSWRDGLIKEWTGKDEKEWWREMINNRDYPWKKVQ